MNDLSPKARAVVEAGRNPGVFTPMDRDRIRQGLRVRLATLGAVTATAGTAAAMSMAAKIAVVTAVVAVLGGGVVAFSALRGPASASAPAARDSSSARPPAVALPPAATPAPAPERTATPLPSGALPSSEVRKSSKRPTATGTSATEDRAAPPLDSELSLLRQAREDLRTGSPGNAYQRLVDYDRRYGKGPLWQERQALSAVALCQWRPGPQAQARAAEFLRNAPQSPLADRVRSACQGANAAGE